ncbi:MAG: hypothetical protein K0S47_647 [Herbinix sp.]|jgi:hypothetical protein|nr:hypothetical protein [Herbinix sp.]
MVQKLFEQNIILYAMAGLCGLGFILRFMLDLVYKRLVKASDNMGATKNKSVKHLKMKFETCYKLKIGVNNVDTFVDKNVFRYRFCGIMLSTWENFCGQVLLLNLLIVPISAAFGFYFKCGQQLILLTSAVGISTSALLILVDKSINLSSKKRALKLNMVDYLENFCKVRLEQEAFHPEQLDQYRKEYFEQLVENKKAAISSSKKVDSQGDELNRRREARRRKEEEKRVVELKRLEEQKKLEEARVEEERRRQEEKKQAAAKRREEERMRIEEDMKAQEARRAEAKKKINQSRQPVENKQQTEQEKVKVLHSIEEELTQMEENQDMEMLMQGLEEIAAEKDRQQVKPSTKTKGRTTNPQEDQLIEDILKEFFA